MDRHDTPFPKHDFYNMIHAMPLPNLIEEYWIDGTFDDYADEHFIIRAIVNDTEFFRKFFVSRHYDIDSETFPSNYLINFNNRLYALCNSFGKSEIKKFLKDQFSAGKHNYDQNKFLEALSEIHILTHFAAFGPAFTAQAFYEPPLGLHGANPEARFVYRNGVTLDIEVKTPNFPKRNYKENILLPGILIDKKGRDKLGLFCEQHSIQCRFPRVLKLKEFFESAAKKFIVPPSENHINLLVINWSYADIEEVKLFEPVKLLCNQANGLFVKRDIALKVGIPEEAMQKITAVLLYRMPENMLFFSDLRYLFQSRSYKIIMNPFVECGNIQMVHDLTSMAVNLPHELDDRRDVFFNFESKDWSEELTKIMEIIDTHVLQ